MLSESVLDDLDADFSIEELAEIRTAINARLTIGNDPATTRKVVDPDLLDSGAFAFRWTDLISLHDVLELIKLFEGSGDGRLLVLKRLLSFWSRLRSIRVPLTESQATVLLAVKRGQNRLSDIIKSTKLPENDVKTIIGELSTLLYLEKTPILREDNGMYSTDF
jgi:hypothetical protein